MKKRLLSLLLAIIMLMACVPLDTIVKVEAATLLTENEFANRLTQLRAKYPNGSTYSGTYYEGTTPKAWQCHGYACQMLYEVFGVRYYTDGYYNKVDYNMGTIYAGDIVRLDAGYGPDTHSVFVTKVTSDRIYFTDGNYDNKNGIRWDGSYTNSEFKSRFTYKVHIPGNTLTGNLTPKPSASLVTPTITFNKSSYVLGDVVKISWKASPSNSNLSHYWIQITDSKGKVYVDKGLVSSITSYSFSTSSLGTYKVKVYATPIGSQAGEGSLTDTKTFTIEAKKTICTIKYNANGGSLGSVPSSQTYTYATTGTTKLSSYKPTRSGYTFLGWSLSKTATSASYSAGHTWQLANKGDYTLYAVWKINSLQVSIRPAGGKINGSSAEIVKNYAYGSKITLPKPTRDGYNFVCWTIDYSGSNHVLEPWGMPLHHDPSFSSSLSDISVYNNANNSNVKIEKVKKTEDCPTSSANMLKISTTGTAYPSLGGFVQWTNSKNSGVFYHMIIAKIPVGYTIQRSSNPCGDGAKHEWLTKQDGTGQFETYIYKTTCGSSGKFGTLGHVYIYGKAATASKPLVWYVGYSEVFQATGAKEQSSYTVGTGVGILRAIWKKCTHKYSNNCDTTCNICNATRRTTHAYRNYTIKATLTKNGKIVKKCSACGVTGGTTTTYAAKTVKLSATTYTYNGKTKTPTVTVKDSNGKTISKSYYTVSYASGRKNVGKYKVTITFKGNYSGSKTLYFKINPVKTSVTKLTAAKKALTVSISKKTKQVTGYEIQYATNKKFSKAKKATIKSYKTTKTTLKKLSAKKTYYVRVRTYKTVGGKKYYSGWSTVKSKKTK